MSLRPVSSMIRVGWLNHDSWSETYVGTRRLVYELLPSSITEQRAEDGALCQLALVGANHLMEVSLFKLLKPLIGSIEEFTQKKFDDSGYKHGLTHWVEKLTGKPLSLELEPFVSTERLRVRRNATVHKSSALATVTMARSALFSATEGTQALYSHFGKKFPYQSFLDQYPLPKEETFYQVQFPPNT